MDKKEGNIGKNEDILFHPIGIIKFIAICLNVFFFLYMLSGSRWHLDKGLLTSLLYLLFASSIFGIITKMPGKEKKTTPKKPSLFSLWIKANRSKLERQIEENEKK